jgi:hypothetical protein
VNSIGSRTYIDYKTNVAGTVTDSSQWFGTSNVFINNGTSYSTIATVYAATGREQHSTLNDATVWTPGLLSPADAATSVSTTPTLYWDGTPGANTYQIQISKVTNFASTVYDDSTWAEFKGVSTTLNANTTYYWRVRTTAAVGGQSSWATYRSFTTANNVTRSKYLRRK